MKVDSCIILTMTDDKGVADKIAEHLVSNKLAACVQIDEVRSIYNWEAKLQKSSEFRLMIKALKSDYAALEKAILDVHNYSLPQIIMLDITGGFVEYFKWLSDSCKK